MSRCFSSGNSEMKSSKFSKISTVSQRPSSQESYAGMKGKYFPMKQKLKEFNIRLALQEMKKGALLPETKEDRRLSIKR